MNKNKIFCTKCGTKNSIDDEKCIKCHEPLNKKHHPLLEYMKSKIEGDLKGKVKDEAFSIIINYIKSNLYGFTLSMTILASATCIIVNETINDTNRIQKVTEKPAIVSDISYSGKGLSAIEVATKYVNAINSNDFDTVRSLQLENFHENVFDYIKDYSDKKLKYPTEKAATSYELVENNEVYFNYNQNDIDIGESPLVLKKRTFGNYTTENFYVSMTYCSYNSCDKAFENGDYYITGIEIQLVNIENNYYVLGERVAAMMGQDQEINLQSLHRANGDTTKFSFAEDYEEFTSCHDDVDCLHQHGFEDSRKRWQIN